MPTTYATRTAVRINHHPTGTKKSHANTRTKRARQNALAGALTHTHPTKNTTFATNDTTSTHG